MAKKSKIKKTLVDQILDKAKIAHDSLSINAFEEILPDNIKKKDIFRIKKINFNLKLNLFLWQY